MYVLPSICNSLASVLPSEMILAFSLASELILKSPAIVVVPSNSTVSASLLLSPSVPFPITKAVLSGLNYVALLVIVEPKRLYCPVTKEA